MFGIGTAKCDAHDLDVAVVLEEIALNVCV